MGRPNAKANIARKRTTVVRKKKGVVVVSGTNIRDYVDKINLTAPQFVLAMNKEKREQVRTGIRESHYDVCRAMLGFTPKHLELIERAMAMAVEMHVPFENIRQVEFYKGQTTILFM